MSQHSAACCSVPPIITKGYKEKGEWIEADGLKTYSVGGSGAKRGIIVVYDIFGYFPQTLQGADILAMGDKDKPTRVCMPDFFEGKPADISWYPPNTKEKGEKLGQFFQTAAAPPKTVSRVPKIFESLKSKYSDIDSWGLVGYCWGGKIVNLSSQSGTPFKAAAACHPAMVDPNDAPSVTIPYAMLPSKDEDKEAVENWQKGLKVKNIVEWFPTQVHGWMAARSDLENDEVKKEYERGYKMLLDFFHEHL